VHNSRNWPHVPKEWKPWPQDVYYMDDESAKVFVDDNAGRILSAKKMKSE
jgi:hypothetical protein